MKKTNSKEKGLETIKDDHVDSLKKSLQEAKSKIDKFQKQILKKFDKYVLGIALLPPKKEDKGKMDIFVLFDDSDSKKMNKLELRDKLFSISKSIAKEIDKDFIVEIALLSELRQDCYDSKWELTGLIGMGMILYDPNDLLAGIKTSEVHKNMVLKKFDKYIVSYVAAGSLFRGEKANDIDVYVIIDDTDVKKMPRLELKEKLRSIIIGQGFEAASITKVDKKFHVQVYILTDFWEGIKDANPVFFTFLRDGVPLYDRGVFMPWKLMLEMGRIKPSPEAIDMFMSTGEKILDSVSYRLREILEKDIYWAVLNPSQAALMLYGVNPPTPKETIGLMDEIFVKKEKILEKKYVDTLAKIRKWYKDMEHEKIKSISGKEIDELLKESEAYLKRIRKLFDEIEKKKEEEDVIQIYEASTKVMDDVLKLNNVKDKDIEKGLKKLTDKGELDKKLLTIFRDLVKAYEDYKKSKLSRAEIDKARKESRVFMRTLIDYIQYKRGSTLDRITVKVKYGKKIGEVIVFDKEAFVIEDSARKDRIGKGSVGKDGSINGIAKSSLEELEKYISKGNLPQNVFIRDGLFKSLKEIFGPKMEVLVGY
ncbi:MAG: hypothetical protein CMH63_03240 [Nanoarchaeota archaeon]|nr:hypothetical protein [Nanoarchaeota archaeon]|tara:strand:- start:4231 stop:6009 length:1779 start_codon:yes stop_codon:yes gene_type:complete